MKCKRCKKVLDEKEYICSNCKTIIDLQKYEEQVDGKIKGEYKLIDKDVLIFSKEEIFGVKVYYNELKNVIIDTSDNQEDEGMSRFQIFFKSIFGG